MGAQVKGSQTDGGRSTAKAMSILASALLALTLASVVWGFVEAAGPLIDVVAISLWVTVTAITGWLIALRRPRNPCGWLLLAVALFANVGIAALEFAQNRSGAGPLGAVVQAAAWLASWLTIPGFAAFIFLLLRFPDGSLPSSRWHWVERAAITGTVLVAVSIALRPGRLEAIPSMSNPMGIDGAGSVLTLIGNIGQPLLGVSAIAAVVSLFVRYRRGDQVQRQRLKWIAYTSAFLLLTAVLAGVVESAGALNEASFFLVVLGLTGLPVSIGIAILRYRLLDIDLLINRTIVYGAMTVGVIGFYVAIVGSLTGVIGRRVSLGASLVATAVIAMAFNPVREGLQRLVNRMMYGQRDDPYAVVASLAHRLEEAASPEAVLPAVVEGIAHSLRLPYVAILIDEGSKERPAAEYGTPAESSDVFPMSHHGEEVGNLVVSLRMGEADLGARDRDLLTDLARQIGPAAHAVRLADDLQRSRASIVRAREEERRRLRRDLHDGLGPELAGISLSLGAAEKMARTDAAAAQEMVAKLNTQLKDAISNVRTIVAGLVPPELERLGLVGAVRERAETFSFSGHTIVDVDAQDIRSMSAATEVAAYRIALEALTNVAKHAHATRCSIRMWVTDVLNVEIVDDGVGIPADHPLGTGLSSMRERVEEIGGTLVIESIVPHGTRVSARLPVGPT